MNHIIHHISIFLKTSHLPRGLEIAMEMHLNKYTFVKICEIGVEIKEIWGETFCMVS